ncbi:cysteine--tRNA ligase [Alphaproteobacteria bacterium]|nr:cysteine--tRNA ligase [Alphaproteobacteria bacterium]
MKIHNTLTRQTEEFVPIEAPSVRVYTCGPTVYNNAHIGNLSAYIYADILVRSLRLAGYDVQQVMNFTDVDDKTIRDSRAHYPDVEPMVALTELTRHYEKVFLEDTTSIGNDISAVRFIRATDCIDEIKNFIKLLLDQQIAYLADDGIYFSIREYSKTRKYGQLSHVDLPAEARPRIDNDEYDKDNAQDFALWKIKKDGEPAWDFDVDGKDLSGRPGWHIECSVMSVNELGQPFDIHTGGVDHIFPHHENEIAQSTAGDQPEKLANYFVHNEHLLVDGAKMSKSKNNFYILQDIETKGFDPLDFRMLILQSHYQSPSNFSWDNLTAAKNRLRAWRNVAELRHQVPDIDDDGQQEIVRGLIAKAGEMLQDNLNTPEALKHIDQAIDIVSKDINNISHVALLTIFEFVDKYLGLQVLDSTPDIPDSIRDLIAVRQVERANGDYAKADEIRDALLSDGISLRDDGANVIWYR